MCSVDNCNNKRTNVLSLVNEDNQSISFGMCDEHFKLYSEAKEYKIISESI